MDLQILAELEAVLRSERDALLSEWRQQIRKLPSARHLDTPALNDHVPVLLDELEAALQSISDKTIPEALLEGSPPVHGLQRHLDGYDIVEVVAEYNILRGCIQDLAERHGLVLHGKAFHILNRVFDEAIGLAVQTFATGQALEIQRRRDEYLAFVAHDLRTPLSAIALAGRVLELGYREETHGGEIAHMLKILRRNVQHLEALVEGVLKESEHVQTESGVKLERREFDLWPMVEFLIHDLHPIAGTASTQLINRVPDELTVFADSNLLKRVIQNLIANAIKHTPRGEVLIGAKEIGDGGAIECWVSDNGAGIPADRLEVVFEKFESDLERDDGTGLGLAIVKTFVEAHGGTVTVDSKEGVGSTFRFTLPGRTGLG